MIVRIDDRLRDPNIVSSWANFLKVDKVIVLNDKLSRLNLEKKLIRLEIDKGIRVIFLEHKDLENAILEEDSTRTLIFVSTVKDVEKLISLGIKIDLIALGQKEFQKGLKALSEDFYVDRKDLEFLNEMTKEGKDILIQENPYSSKRNINNLFII
ncbi:PTS sugar transporter subunit IIB [Anaerococcus sp. AGMB00486]|uniref:PTS sugar transporter subunit IIB n=1 Tax=Anaerococcus faecalis TaxID=2742993 RepID=A0ABX2NBX6_9FIRM|nr:PTS sugar transporter subunit IIB [Anaerococcus faecalis]NVF12188.1 PTS sugar transporter subunit IIB [Anaerococcus faecalis]